MVEERSAKYLGARARILGLSTGGRIAGRISSALVSRIRTAERRIFLTFDDGPTPSLTTQIGRILWEQHARGTFFVSAERAIRHKQVVTELETANHCIASHGVNHEDYWRTSARSVRANLSEADEIIRAIARKPSILVRPPYGHVRPCVLDWCQTTGRTCVLWDVMPGDFSLGGNTGPLIDATLRQLRPGSILVLHDSDDGKSFERLQFVSALVHRLAEDGWTMDQTIEEALSRRTD